MTHGGGLWRTDCRGAVTGPGPDSAAIAAVAPGVAVSEVGWRALAGPRAGGWRPWSHVAETVAVAPGGGRVAAVGAVDAVVRITDAATGAVHAVPGADHGLALALDDRDGALVAGWATVTIVAGARVTPVAIPDAAVIGLDAARAEVVLGARARRRADPGRARRAHGGRARRAGAGLPQRRAGVDVARRRADRGRGRPRGRAVRRGARRRSSGSGWAARPARSRSSTTAC